MMEAVLLKLIVYGCICVGVRVILRGVHKYFKYLKVQFGIFKFECKCRKCNG